MFEKFRSIFVDVESLLRGWTYPKEDIDSYLLEKSDIGHNHDEVYYTQTEMDAKLLVKTDDNSLSTVAKTGSYNDLSNTPEIPSKVSDLSNDTGFLTNNDAYLKSDTFTRAEIRQLISEAIANIVNIEVVNSLPTFDIDTNKMYLIRNIDNQNNVNRYDVYIYVGSSWEQIDSLEFNIDDYPTKTELAALLLEKAGVNHAHGNISNAGAIGSTQGKIITTGQNGVLSASDNISSSKITNGSALASIGSSANATQENINTLINTKLNDLNTNKANSTHTHTASQITDLNTVSMIVTYEDSTSETVTLYGER